MLWLKCFASAADRENGRRCTTNYYRYGSDRGITGILCGLIISTRNAEKSRINDDIDFSSTTQPELLFSFAKCTKVPSNVFEASESIQMRSSSAEFRLNLNWTRRATAISSRESGATKAKRVSWRFTQTEQVRSLNITTLSLWVHAFSNSYSCKLKLCPISIEFGNEFGISNGSRN